MNEDFSLDELKERSKVAYQNGLYILGFLTIIILISFVYRLTQIDKSTRQFTNDMVTTLSANVKTDVDGYIATKLGNCVVSRQYRARRNNEYNLFDGFNKVQFLHDLNEIKGQCINEMEEQAVLLNSRGTKGSGVDKEYADKIRNLVKTQS